MISEAEKAIMRRTALAKLLRLAYELGGEDERECPGEVCSRDFAADAEKLTGRESAANDAEVARVTAERDAALNDLEKCAADANELCEYCINDGRCLIPDDEMDSAWPDCYEWRGASRNSEAAEQALKGFVTDENNN